MSSSSSAAAAAGTAAGGDGSVSFTSVEAVQYDRQLRLWGAETQLRLRAARALVVGARALGAEVAKNLVLAGVGSVSLLDNAPAARAAPGNFLVPCDAPADATCAPRGAPAPRAPSPAPQRP